MAEQEVLNFDDVHAPIYRIQGPGCYIAFRPPLGDPYVVASKDMEPQQIIEFTEKRLDLIRSLRSDMAKRFKKSPSLACKYKTGDVAYLLGRPLMVKVYPNTTGKVKKNSRGRATVSARLDEDVSIINLFVIQIGDYDQRRAAYHAWAESIYLNNARQLMADCLNRADGEAARITQQFSEEAEAEGIDGITAGVASAMASRQLSGDPALSLQPRVASKRSIHGRWADVNQVQGIVCFARELIGYPIECSAYAFMAAISYFVLPEGASDAERAAFVALGCPTWQHAKDTLAEENSIFMQE